jgi:hypothetical protein
MVGADRLRIQSLRLMPASLSDPPSYRIRTFYLGYGTPYIKQLTDNLFLGFLSDTLSFILAIYFEWQESPSCCLVPRELA